MNRNALALVLVGCLLVLSALGWAWSGKVVGVIDGDSITVLHDGRREQISLWGIDCPRNIRTLGRRPSRRRL